MHSKLTFRVFCLLMVTLFYSSISSFGVAAETVEINAREYGWVLNCTECDRFESQTGKILQPLHRNFHGVMLFSLPTTDLPVAQAQIKMNQVVFPSDVKDITVFGIDDAPQSLEHDIFFLGSPIGLWNQPRDLVGPIPPLYWTFDVTDFLQSAQGTSVGFRLAPRDGYGGFYGPTLIVTYAPEPSCLCLAAIPAAICLGLRRRRRRSAVRSVVL